MASAKKYRRRPSLVFNMAPMIDVVFLLIIFFVLVSTFASAERVPMEVPNPDVSQALNIKLTDRVIINVQRTGPTPSDVVYSIGASGPESLAVISQRLALHKRLVPNLKVIVRADRRVRYGAVREVMTIVAENGIEQMNIVAQAGNGVPKP